MTAAVVPIHSSIFGAAPLRQTESRIRQDGSLPGWSKENEPVGCFRLVVGIALHVCVITVLVSVLLFEPRIVHGLQQTPLAGKYAPLGLAGAAVVELIVFKLVFAVPILRVLVFAVYTATLALLIASIIKLVHVVSAMVSLGLIAVDWCLRVGLSIVGIYGADNLNGFIVGGIPLVLVGSTLCSVVYFTDISDSTFLTGFVCEVVSSVWGQLAVERLYETLSLEEAHWGVYFLNVDLLIAGILQGPYYVCSTIVWTMMWLWIMMVAAMEDGVVCFV